MRLLRRLAGAVAVGLGMVFASRRREEHWSTPPVVVVREAESADDGEPDQPMEGTAKP